VRARGKHNQQTFMGFRHICRKAAAKTTDVDMYTWIVLNDVWRQLGMGLGRWRA